MRYWNISSVTFLTGDLRFTQLASHKGRIFGSGIVGNERTIYGSEFLRGYNFTLAVDPSDTDPVRIQVQGGLDEPLTTLYSNFKNALVWAKAHSFGLIHGTKRSALTSQIISQEVGTAYPHSMKDCDGRLRFLGPSRTAYEYDGTSLVKINEQNDTLFSQISQGDVRERSWFQTSQQDWAQGTFGPGLSSTTAVGDIVHVSFITPDDNFSDGELENNPTWQVGGTSMTVSNSPNRMAYFSVPAISNEIGTSQSLPTFTTVTWRIGTSGIMVNLPQEQIVHDYTYCFSCSASSLTSNGYRIRMENVADTSTRTIRLVRDTTDIISFSTPISNPTSYNLAISRSPDGIFNLYRFEGTLANPQPDILLGTVQDSTYPILGYFVMGGAGGANQNGENLLARWDLRGLSTEWNGKLVSTFTSTPFNVGNSNINSWSNFTANYQINGGSFSYRLYTDTNASFVDSDTNTYTNSQDLISGQIPTIATSSYFAVRTLFNRTSSTQTPTLNDFTVRWVEGSSIKTPALWTNQRYWLPVAISSFSNNTVFVYDRLNNWNRYSGMDIAASVIYNSQPLFGNSTGTFQAETGYNDDGTNIVSYWKNKNYFFAGLNTRKFFDELYMTTTRNDSMLQTEYYIDGVNTAYSLSNYTMNEQSGIQNFRLPFTSTQLNQGKSVSLKWTVSGQNAWRILNGELMYQSETTNIE